jgi:4-hydroxy-4-methyl-2-oxoglutarate aldolase
MRQKGELVDATVNTDREVIPQDVLDAFMKVGVGDIGHVRQFGFMHSSIRPVWRDIKLVGRATTVRMPGMDTSLNRKAIAMAKPGDVIVIDRGGDTEIAAWGGFATALAIARGVAGVVIDGATTDTMEITDLRFPLFSRTVSGLVGRSLGVEGEINTVVNCGGVPVAPGDIIVADDDGIVVIRPNEAAETLRKCRERFGATPNIREWVREGKPMSEYPGVGQFLESLRSGA